MSGDDYVDVVRSERHMLVRRAGGLSLPGGTSPGVTVLPIITGTAIVGQVLTCSTGTWSNSPTGYAYQWKRGGVNIGTNANTYTLVAADDGALISCVVTATNASGSGSSPATAVGPVLGVPVNSVAPVLSGTPTVGQTLSSTTGNWTNSPASYAYSWYRGATFISSGAGSTYLLVAADTGFSITCRVTASNAAGTGTEVASNAIGPVVAGGASLLEGETNGIGVDFTYSTDAQRIAKKVAGVTTYYAPDTVISNASTWPKMVYDVAGNIGWAPHNIYWPSEDLRSNWTLSSATAPTATFFLPSATLAAHRVTQSISGSSGQFTYVVDVSPSGYSKVGILITGSTGEVAFDISLGTIIHQNTPSWTTSIAPSPLGGGIYRITVTGLGNASGFSLYVLNPVYTTGLINGSWTADGVSGINIFRQQLNRGMTACPYLQSTSAVRTSVVLDYDPVTHAPLGMLSEGSLSQLCLWNSDFTQAVWVKTNMTASALATGGPIDQCSTLTATAANATVLQSITVASAGKMSSCFIKRRTGSGNIDITQDNGTTWTAAAVTASWKRYSVPIATITNPVVGIRIATSGDAVDVAYFQLDPTLNSGGISSPVTTVGTATSRVADNYTFLLSALPALGAEYSVYVRFATPLPATASVTGPIILTDGTINETVKIFLAASSLRQQVTDGGVATGIVIGDTVVANTFMSAANRISAGAPAMSTNGSAVGTAVPISLPTLTEVRFGTAGGSTAGPNIYRIQKFSIITNRGWSDAELQTKSVT